MGTVTVKGADGAPWFPNMAEVMDRDFELLDELATEYVNAGGEPSMLSMLWSHQLPDQTVGRELAPDREAIPVRTGCWLGFVDGYWLGIHMGERFRAIGAARGAVENELLVPEPPNESTMEMICLGLTEVYAGFSGTREEKLGALEASLRMQVQCGTLYGTAYNTGFFQALLHHPPLGALPDRLRGDPGLVVASADRLLEVEYRDAVAGWLTVHKERHAAARAEHPDRWEALVQGSDGQPSLEDVWRDGYLQGVYNWGGDTFEGWDQPELDNMIGTSVPFNVHLEAISHAVIATVLDPSDAAIEQALRASALYLPVWLGLAVGIGDETGVIPELVAV